MSSSEKPRPPQAGESSNANSMKNQPDRASLQHPRESIQSEQEPQSCDELAANGASFEEAKGANRIRSSMTGQGTSLGTSVKDSKSATSNTKAHTQAQSEKSKMEINSQLASIQSSCHSRFHKRESIRSFHKFLADFDSNPYLYLRTAPRYILDMMEHFGTEEVDRIGVHDQRWKLFDLKFGIPQDSLIGQEGAQNRIVAQLRQFARQGRADKMILLHGPNGSSKSTIVEILQKGLEEYSQQSEGSLYRFNWIFTEHDGKLGKIGFENEELEDGENVDSYAKLGPQEISAKIPCELKDSPLFLIPHEERKILIEQVLEKNPEVAAHPDFNYDYFVTGDLCPKCRNIYDALLAAYQGDWGSIIRHIQVERYYFSQRYRSGALSIEPQGNIDASLRPLNYEPTIILPSVLQTSPVFEMTGDLIDANHGIVEYSDFLKRPIEANKYLLTTSEKGTIQLSNYTAFLDMFITGTANELQLSMFKRNPDFSSFKARIELIKVPYLLKYCKEAELYTKHLDVYARGRHIAPHTATIAALWAVLTRLRRPHPKNYEAELAPIVAKLTPMLKAKLYSSGELPVQFKDKERTALASNLRAIRLEHVDAEGEFEGMYGGEYEGRRGASPREMMGLLGIAGQSKSHDCLTPIAVIEELDKLTRDASVYEFLRIPNDNGYHDCESFLDEVKAEYLSIVKQEVYSAIGLVDEAEYERVFQEYFHHVKAFDLGEKLYIEKRGEYIEPSEQLMQRIETLLTIKEPIEEYRSNLITRIAAYKIDHPTEQIVFQDLFPQIYENLKQSFYHERDRTLTIVEQNILRHDTEDYSVLSDQDRKQADDALERLKSMFGYCDTCAKEVVAFVLQDHED